MQLFFVVFTVSMSAVKRFLSPSKASRATTEGPLCTFLLTILSTVINNLKKRKNFLLSGCEKSDFI